MAKPTHEPLDIQQRGLPIVRTKKLIGDHEMINPALRVWLEEKAGADSRSTSLRSPEPSFTVSALPGNDQG
jgi:hypothetical protein